MTCIKTEYAKWADLPRIKELCLLRACESNYQDCAPIDEYQIEKYIVKQWKCVPCIIIRDDAGVIVSFAGLCIDSHWWSVHPKISFYMVYVTPEDRGRGHVQALHKAAQDASDQALIPLFDNYIATDRHKARTRQMQSMGYECVGMHFKYKGGE